MFQSVQGDLKDLDDRDRVCLGGWDLSLVEVGALRSRQYISFFTSLF